MWPVAMSMKAQPSEVTTWRMSTSWRMPVAVPSPPSGCNEHSSRATTLPICYVNRPLRATVAAKFLSLVDYGG